MSNREIYLLNIQIMGIIITQTPVKELTMSTSVLISIQFFFSELDTEIQRLINTFDFK